MRWRSGSAEPEGPGQLVDGGRFAAGNDEAVEAVEFGRAADADARGTGSFHRVQVFAEVALECQDADPQALFPRGKEARKRGWSSEQHSARGPSPGHAVPPPGGLPCRRWDILQSMFYFSVPLGKFVRRVSRLRGGGSALPGLVVEKIDPGFMRRTLSTLPHGVAVVSGTNGKTTTTKMVVELLESQGLKVFTNRTGSNFTRGVAAALLGEVDWRGRLDADVAVLELDEAHAVHFVNQVPPRYCLLLNVLRDQLDRFGEIDKTAQLLQHIASKTTGTVVLNREDPRVARIAETLTADHAHGPDVLYFGLDDSLLSTFPNDDEMRAAPGSPVPPAPAQAARRRRAAPGGCGRRGL